MRIYLTIAVLMASVVLGVSYAATRPSAPVQPPRARQDAAAAPGAVSGLVVNTEGEPVSGAEILASHPRRGGVGKLPATQTDERGEFLLKDLAPGPYVLSVNKIEQGHPYSDSAFYSDGVTEAPQVLIREGETIPGVVLYLRPKAAELTGRLIDADTNKPIKGLKNARITLRRADNPDAAIYAFPDAEGEFSELVTSAPFTIAVSAPGYEEKHLPSPGVRAGRPNRLDISLRPAK